MANTKTFQRVGKRWVWVQFDDQTVPPELARERREIRSWLDADEENAEFPNLAEELARDGFLKDRVYLRLGDPPERGRSETGDPRFSKLEPGVSVFKGRMTKRGDFVLRLGTLALHGALFQVLREGRPAYFAWGTPVGRGICGEPCLGKKARYEPVPAEAIIASSPPSAALELWHAHHGDLLSVRMAKRRSEANSSSSSSCPGTGSDPA